MTVQPSFIFFPTMAMTTITKNPMPALRRRVRQFYDLLNDGFFERCHQMIDPRVRDKPNSVTLLQYENALRQFLEETGSVTILEMSLALHLNEPNELYEGRDFALGKTTCVDSTESRHVFLERWVREGRTWYTRSTGMLMPKIAK